VLKASTSTRRCQPPTQRRRPLCAIWRSGCCPNIKTPIRIDISANLSVLQLTAGDYSSAVESRESLHERRRRADSGRPVGRGRVLDIYARTMAIVAQRHVPFAEAFGTAYQEVFSKLNDHDAFMLSGWLAAPPRNFSRIPTIAR